VEGCPEPVVGGVGSIQLVGLHDMSVCRRNPCTFLQSCQLDYARQNVLGLRLQWLRCSSIHLLKKL
jgi:hypothetical protein